MIPDAPILDRILQPALDAAGRRWGWTLRGIATVVGRIMIVGWAACALQYAFDRKLISFASALAFAALNTHLVPFTISVIRSPNPYRSAWFVRFTAMTAVVVPPYLTLVMFPIACWLAFVYVVSLEPLPPRRIREPRGALLDGAR